MRILFCSILFLFSTVVFAQEIGSVQNGKHSIKLIKNSMDYSLLYSNVMDDAGKGEATLSFPNIETIYTIIMDGFKNSKNHKIFVYTKNDTIVKFEYVKLYGKKLLAINQNNLSAKTKSRSNFFTKKDIENLFMMP